MLIGSHTGSKGKTKLISDRPKEDIGCHLWGFISSLSTSVISVHWLRYCAERADVAVFSVSDETWCPKEAIRSTLLLAGSALVFSSLVLFVEYLIQWPVPLFGDSIIIKTCYHLVLIYCLLSEVIWQVSQKLQFCLNCFKVRILQPFSLCTKLQLTAIRPSCLNLGEPGMLPAINYFWSVELTQTQTPGRKHKFQPNKHQGLCHGQGAILDWLWALMDCGHSSNHWLHHSHLS